LAAPRRRYTNFQGALRDYVAFWQILLQKSVETSDEA